MRNALPVDLPIHPSAGVVIAVGQGIGALAVLNAVLEGAFIDPAIVVLLGLHLIVGLRARKGCDSDQ
ncbi:hypothetical protein GALL_498370 [mine drainage metagenome]|uniref:Uncharacterized protein n=1 Tax=mine drainage metagenome TaxID=410659 RepID=A0A1J5PAD5_9ZZZZ